MTIPASLDGPVGPDIGRGARRRIGRLSVQLREMVPATLAAGWIVLVPTVIMIAWWFGRPRMVLTALGAATVIVISMVAAGAVLSQLHLMLKARRVRRDGIVRQGDSGGVALPRVQELARCWVTEPGAGELSRFLANFDGCLSVMTLRLTEKLGDEMVASMPLYQRIELAEELGVWSADDVANWRACLRLRVEILADGAGIVTDLSDYSRWLDELNLRTFAAVA